MGAFADVTPAQNLDVSTLRSIFACDSTGQFLMGRLSPLEAGAAKGKSSDYSSSWTGMGSLPYIGNNWHFAWLGGEGGIKSVWGAAGGTSVRRCADFGITWENREGNLISDFPVGGWDFIVSVDDLYI
jgi:hypothetical protein